ncbi:winged helix-turn-helix domain-containing protein [Thermoproteus tenax]|uniref:Molybdenum-pterin binding protein n=1 Tax=Thermoproteus tenax (strain ATCC 35583 / DSM 2078 / JCM 9277 / NBRC 100435 / Kra 1) TaxID=768679 RepID=G4RLT2_THETK|nr:winged helix-turn-helix domain-containing protein [Thermoproteus tenax]CCC82527.1 Molybdenum-pterin binding protein [Thermoproteus tenax Kra 1]
MPDDVKIKYRIWVEWGTNQIIGPGIYDILKAIEETGSIASAARKLGFSYKFIWTYLKKLEDILQVPLVQSKRGGKERGKTELTEIGQILLKYYEDMNKEINTILPAWESKFKEVLNSLDKYRVQEAETGEEELPFYSEE